MTISGVELRSRDNLRRPTLALVTNALAQNYYAQAIIDAADEAAERAGFDLVVFVAGHYLEGDLAAPANRMLLSTMRSGWFDGLIALPVGPYFKVAELDAFYKRFRGTPICSVATALPSFPSIVVSGEDGARESVDHLIRVHGKKRIALLRGIEGTEEYDERFRGWQAAFQSNGLQPDPELIFTTESYGPNGGEVVRLLLEERRTPIDALVAANDAMAIDAVRELRRLEVRVPTDIAVCGFDDAPQARHSSPPLTTVRQPLHELGQRAVETVLAALRGEDVPARQVLHARLLVRQSCGCVRHPVRNRGLTDAPEAPVVASGHRSSITPSTRPSHRPIPVAGLQEALRADVTSANGLFLPRLRAVLEEAAAIRGEVGDAHDLLTRLRSEELVRISNDSAQRERLEDLVHASRILVSELDAWALVEDRSRVYWWALKLNQSSEALTTSLTMPMLMERFQTGIHEFEIPRCAVALFEGSDLAPEQASVVLAYEASKGSQLIAESTPFRCADHLLPLDLWEHDRRRVYVVECIHGQRDPLRLETGREVDALGYAVFEMGPRDGLVYQCLRDQIGAAIKGLAVWQRLLQEVEKRQSAERLYERMASLGRLTAGIAHGMNTPVAAVRAALQHLSGLVEEYRSGVGDAALTPADHQEVAREMAVSIKAASSASTRVAEFLRSIRLQTREAAPVEASTFDVVTVVRDTLLLLDHAIRVGGCMVQVTSSGDLIELSGDPARFSQIMSNLVTNAVEASAAKKGGEIVVDIRDKGDAVDVIVTDQGDGIEPGDIDRIFDPMFTTRGFGDHSGLGLSIVHDLVTGAFGGSIEVQSERGKGAAFTVHLPRARTAPATES